MNFTMNFLLLFFLIFSSPGAPFAITTADGRQFFEYQLEPGDDRIIEDVAALSNLGASPAVFRIWPAAGKSTSNGTWNLANGALASWLTLESGEAQVPAGFAVQVPFQLRIPEGQPDGEFLLGLMAEPSSNDDRSGGINLIQRSGVAIMVRIGNPSNCSVRMTAISFVQNQVRARVNVGISNLGDVHFTGSGSIEIEALKQSVRFPFVVSGDEFEFRLGVPILPPGKYALKASMQSDDYPECNAKISGEAMVLPDSLPAMGVEHPPQGEPPESDILDESVSVSPGEANALDTPLVQSLICGLLGAAAGLGVVVLYAWRTLRKSKTRRVYSSDLYTARRDEK